MKMVTLVLVCLCSCGIYPQQLPEIVKLKASGGIKINQIKELNNAGYIVNELHYRYKELQGGITILDHETLSTALLRGKIQHDFFINQSFQELEIIALDPNIDLIEFDKTYNALIELDQLYGLPKFVEITITIPTTLARDDLRRIIPDLESIESFDFKDKDTEEEISPEPYSISHETWAPYGGTTEVLQSMSYQTFIFNDINSFDVNSTYEHETQVYDKNFANYGGYWSSNLPNAYYDTPFLDSIDNFTVGSAQAVLIKRYKTYYTYMSLIPQSSISALVRIKGQKGHRYPSWCYSTWCIFADATTGTIVLLSAPMYGMSWSY